ncbi:hypothetical protein UT300012_23820 [Paraclostridium bifermentans]
MSEKKQFRTPDNIDDLTLDEIKTLASESDFGNVVSVEARYQIMSKIYSVLGFDMDKDLLLMLLSEPNAMLSLATAGGGKTTASQVKIMAQKIYRKTADGKPLKGERMLCLVYNDHNVAQMEKKHKELVSRLYASGIKGLNIDSEIHACTMHKYCKKWILDSKYLKDTGLLGATIMKSSQTNSLMTTVYKLVCKKYKVEPDLSKINDMLQLYNYMIESLREYDDCGEIDLFTRMGIPAKVIADTFTAYDKMKTRKNLYDFTDMPRKFLELLKNNDAARERVQNYVDYIVADEVQDMTPIMMEILRYIKGPNVPLLAMGDEDQSIYGFRGADIYNTLDFENKFEGGEVYSLATNRRCRKEIINVAKQIVNWNELRFDKTIRGIKPEGRFSMIPYGTRDGMMINLVNQLKELTGKELEEVCICYRNRKSSALLADKLEEAKIPFNIISGYKPFHHEIYNHLIGILDGLYRPVDREYYKNLYKLLPWIKRREFFDAIGYIPETKDWKTENERIHFSQVDYGKYNNHKGFQQGLRIATQISKMMKDKPMKAYINQLIELFIMAYWKDKMYLNDNEEEDTFYTERAKQFFNSDLTYGGFEVEYSKRKTVVENNIKTGSGVAISTFHSLKGLEFDRVYLIDLEDETFPNFGSIEQIDAYSEQTKLELKEAETRLFYVACTRARDYLTLYYSQDNPSVYVNWILEGKGRVIEEAKPVDEKMKHVENMSKILTNVSPNREANKLSERIALVEEAEKIVKEQNAIPMGEMMLEVDDDIFAGFGDSLLDDDVPDLMSDFGDTVALEAPVEEVTVIDVETPKTTTAEDEPKDELSVADDFVMSLLDRL